MKPGALCMTVYETKPGALYIKPGALCMKPGALCMTVYETWCTVY
jgi:hypothetical protein